MERRRTIGEEKGDIEKRESNGYELDKSMERESKVKKRGGREKMEK